MSDPYTLLGVPSSASLKEIKRAYLALAKKYHPDVNNGDDNSSSSSSSLSRFKEISAAYDVLKDPEKRRQLDSDLRNNNKYPRGFNQHGAARTKYDPYEEWQAQENAWNRERGGADARRRRAARTYAKTSTARYENAGRVLKEAWVASPHVTKYDAAFLAGVFAVSGVAAISMRWMWPTAATAEGAKANGSSNRSSA